MMTSSSEKREKTITSYQQCDDQTSSVAATVVPHQPLPDLVVHQILQLLPTKSAIRMSFLSKQWQSACFFGPVIDFDEGGNNNVNKHKEFVRNILQMYLEFCEKSPEKHDIRKFKLRMTRYLTRDANIVNNWLRISCERSVKELDISLKPVSELHRHRWNDMTNYDLSTRQELMKARTVNRIQNFFYLSQMALVNAKSLTTLSLEYVSLKKIDNGNPLSVGGLLPSIKSMSFKTVHFHFEALFSLICECPFIENLSLTSCTTRGDIKIQSSSLRSLEIERCEAFFVRVYEAKNLESLSVVSGIGSTEYPLLFQVILSDCYNLKYMNIKASHLESFHLDGCQDVKGTIDAPALEFFTFIGYLKSKFSLKAPSLKMSTQIVLLDDWDRKAATSSKQREHYFTTLSGFLQEFAISKTLDLCVSDFKAVVFPEDLRKTQSSPLFPNLEKLYFSTKIPPERKTSDGKDLKDSLLWMAPYSRLIKYLPWEIRPIRFS